MNEGSEEIMVTAPIANWSRYRERFPILSNSVYYDTAYKASVPTCVSDAILDYLHENQSQAGDKVSLARDINLLRAKIADFIGCHQSEIAFTKNASEGMNLLAHAISYREGDNVIISDQEHPTNECPWLNLARLGVEVRKVPSKSYCFDVRDIEKLVDNRTRIISLSAVCQISGYVPNLPAIADFCSKRGILFYLDAIQALGVHDLRVDEIRIDGLVTSGHKWLLGPYGTGFLYASSKLMDQSVPIFASKHYSRLDLKDPNTSLISDAGCWEYGSLNYPGLFGLAAALDMILEVGIDCIEARVNDLVTDLRSGIEKLGLQTVTPTARDGRPSGIFSFAVSNAAGVAAALRDRRIFVSERKGILRTSQHFYNDEKDLAQFIDALKSTALV